MNEQTIKLQANHGMLLFPFGDWQDNGPMLLIRCYSAGDCCRIAWPFRGDADRENLAYALFDAFESIDGSGLHRPVMLPDGTTFDHLRYVK